MPTSPARHVTSPGKGDGVKADDVPFLHVVSPTAEVEAEEPERLKHSSRRPPPTEKNPYDSANLLSRATIWWLNPLIHLGSKKMLSAEDLWAVPTDHDIYSCAEQFAPLWEQALARGGKYPLPSALLRLILGWFIASGVSQACYITLQMLTPYLVEALVGYITGEPTGLLGLTSGFYYAALLGCVTLLSVTVMSVSFNLVIKVGLNVRNACMDMVYRKALVLSASAKQGSTTGEIVTLMSVDAERLFQAFMSFHWIWAAPVMLAVGMGLMVKFIGVGAFAGVGVMVVFLVVQAYIAKLIGKARKETVINTQERVKLLTDCLQGVRVLKFNAWEKPIEDKVEAARKKEIYHYKKLGYTKAVNQILMFLSPVMVLGSTFAVYVATGNDLTVTKVFTTMAFINLVRMPLNFFPQTLASIMEAKVASDRLEKFFMLEEVDRKGKEDEDLADTGLIQVVDGSFSWSHPGHTLKETKEEDEKKTGNGEDAAVAVDAEGGEKVRPVLTGVNISIKPKSLVGIVGPVGSGKSSLISGILGQMHQLSGTRMLKGKVAYAAQQPWIQHKTLRENILFESAYNRSRYKKVIQVSELSHDLSILPAGDRTEIGERGINLSGGQKARVSLARAFYCPDADIVVMDDPLSAVDAHVAKKIMDKAVLDFCKDRTRLLVLNSHYHFLKHFDQVIIVENGKVVGYGAPGDLAPLFPKYFNVPDEEEELEAEKVDGASVDGETREPLASELRESQLMTTVTKRGDLMLEEERREGAVEGKVYKDYFAAMGSWGFVLAMLVLLGFLAAQMTRSFSDWWLSAWGEQRFGTSQTFYIWVYIVLGVGTALFTLYRSFMFVHLTLSISYEIHQKIFACVLRAPVTTFYDVTPLGRIVNRFSRDLDQVDAFLPDFMTMLLANGINIIIILIICCFTSPYILLVFAPMAVVFFFVDKYFRRTSRELKRLESISRSPIYSSFNETLNGLMTIRAYSMEEKFSRKNREAVNVNVKSFFTYWMSSRWLAYRLDLLSSLVVFSVGMFSVGFKNSVNPGIAGLALTYSLQLTGMLQWTVRCAIMVENSMTSTERIFEYAKLEQEGTKKEVTAVPEASWPSEGGILVENLQLRYRPELELVLKGMNMTIRPGEKIGLCGRTGAGKSSIMMALFRMVEPEGGRIVIDGIDVSTISLHALRQKLSIIPQDPVMFSGTIRDNLDPFYEYSDADLWQVLDRVHLRTAIEEMPLKLESPVAEGGENISVGQRQLICIGRALLKKTKILVMDEATASVDSNTDSLIQETIRENFSDRTVLCIAHRLETIIDSDRIAVISDGKVVEFDEPLTLVSNKESSFMGLANELGADVVENLVQLARKKADRQSIGEP